MKTKLNILNDTVKFYSNLSNRAVNDSSACEYRMEAKDKRCKEKKCAVGRHLTKKQLDVAMETGAAGASDLIMQLFEAKLITDRYYLNGHHQSFWDDLQILHDASENFNKTSGYSKRGKEKIEQIKLKINLNNY